MIEDPPEFVWPRDDHDVLSAADQRAIQRAAYQAHIGGWARAEMARKQANYAGLGFRHDADSPGSYYRR